MNCSFLTGPCGPELPLPPRQTARAWILRAGRWVRGCSPSSRSTAASDASQLSAPRPDGAELPGAAAGQALPVEGL